MIFVMVHRGLVEEDGGQGWFTFKVLLPPENRQTSPFYYIIITPFYKRLMYLSVFKFFTHFIFLLTIFFFQRFIYFYL